LIFIPAKLQKVTHTYINYTCKLTQTIDVIVSQMKVNRSRPVNGLVEHVKNLSNGILNAHLLVFVVIIVKLGSILNVK